MGDLPAARRCRAALVADELDAVIYRPRTTPETSINYAFFALEPFTVESWPLAERTDVLTELVLRHGFTVGWELP